MDCDVVVANVVQNEDVSRKDEELGRSTAEGWSNIAVKVSSESMSPLPSTL